MMCVDRYRKKPAIKHNAVRILAHFTVALLALNLSFLLDTPLASYQADGLCKTIAVALHFSLLSTVTWVGINGFALFMQVYNVFKRHEPSIRLLSLIGWGEYRPLVHSGLLLFSSHGIKILYSVSIWWSF
nr:PREDICTED: G-protein coupled receptor 56-like [Latimeria chalumnae]|eukprot:XP_014339426.1 PREDICTED: G-protein coupled receptor 56-like [Latimeria chalumnae]